jgi:ATP-binding protein involved in chromosome partitioning
MTVPFEPGAGSHLHPADAFGPKTRVVSLSSGKGGVGKSSVTANLAVALHKLGRDVCVIDADVYGFSIPKILGVQEEPSVENDKIKPAEVSGIKVVSMGFFVPEDRAVIWRGPMLHKALQQFVTDVAWGEPDYVLVDMPPGTGDVAISMAQFLPWSEVVVVTTPQHAAERVAQRMAAMAEKVNLSVVGVIENMSYFDADDGKRYEIFGSGGGEELATKLGVPLLGKIPLDQRLREGADAGRPVVEFAPDASSAKAIVEIAGELDRLEPPERSLSLGDAQQMSPLGPRPGAPGDAAAGGRGPVGIPLRASPTFQPGNAPGQSRAPGASPLRITPKKRDR